LTYKIINWKKAKLNVKNPIACEHTLGGNLIKLKDKSISNKAVFFTSSYLLTYHGDHAPYRFILYGLNPHRFLLILTMLNR
jgi:hypothetical protein